MENNAENTTHTFIILLFLFKFFLVVLICQNSRAALVAHLSVRVLVHEPCFCAPLSKRTVPGWVHGRQRSHWPHVPYCVVHPCYEARQGLPSVSAPLNMAGGCVFVAPSSILECGRLSHMDMQMWDVCRKII